MKNGMLILDSVCCFHLASRFALSMDVDDDDLIEFRKEIFFFLFFRCECFITLRLSKAVHKIRSSLGDIETDVAGSLCQ